VSAPAPTADPPVIPRWGFGDVFATLIGTVVVGTVTATVLLALEHGPMSAPAGKSWALVVGLVVPWTVLGGWPLYAAWRKGGGPVADYGLRLTWRGALFGVAGGAVALLCASWVADIQVKVTHHPFDSTVGDAARDVAAGSHGALVVLALCTAIGAPIVEELAFRGLTYGSFRKSGQPRSLSVLWTTVIFALFHLEPVRLPVLLVLGAFLGLVRARTGSTAASMVAHATVNVAGALQILALG
jgi:hypothetical protein